MSDIKPLLWVAFADNGNSIRFWTRDPDQAHFASLSGLPVQPVYAEPPADTERKAAAFDWLMARMQEAYDQGGWVEVGDMSIGAHTIWGHREECLMKAEIQWKDRRDEPLDLLAAINQSIAQAGGAA